MANALVFRDVGKMYGDVVALRNIDLEIREGELFAILGPNGAGKTTLLKIAVGLIQPSSGEVRVFGVDVLKEPAKVKELIGYVPQETIVYDELTGLENLMFYASLYDIPKSIAEERISEYVKLLGLEEHVKRRVSKYSGGLKKRLSIAASLIHDPKLLILDEPTTGLDPSSRRELWRILQELRKLGKTIVMATHYMEEAEVLADRVAIMNEGRVIAIGTPDELKKKVGELTIVEVEVANPKLGLEEVLKPYSAGGRVLIKDTVLRIYLEEYETLLPKVIEELFHAGVKPLTIRVSEPTLEDVFIYFAGGK